MGGHPLLCQLIDRLARILDEVLWVGYIDIVGLAIGKDQQQAFFIVAP